MTSEAPLTLTSPSISSTPTPSTRSSSTATFFPDPDPTTPTSAANPKKTLTKDILGYLVLSIACVILICMVVRRLYRLKRGNEPVSTFFHLNYGNDASTTVSRTGPQTMGLPASRASELNQTAVDAYPATLPMAYMRDSRGDVGFHDRGLGGGPREYDETADKHLPPDYETVGRPPKYAESEIQTQLFSEEGPVARHAQFNSGTNEHPRI